MMSVTNLSPREDGLLAYREWLRGLVIGPAPTYHNPELFDIAWDTNYIPTVPNDQNRCQDAIDLRPRYVNETSNSLPAMGECTMLEFLIGLSIRLNDASYTPQRPDQIGSWFWALLDNLGIIEENYIGMTRSFEKINTRGYDHDGFGGLFPLRRSREDQRNVEIWYQMQAYLMENR